MSVNSYSNMGSQSNVTPNVVPVNVFKETGKNLGKLILGGIIGSALFSGVYWVINLFNIYYVFASILSIIVVYFIGLAWDGITDGAKNPLESSIRSFVIIFFVLSLLHGYNLERIEANNIKRDTNAELVSYDQTWSPKKIFRPQEEVFVTIKGGSVGVGDTILPPGNYLIPIKSIGVLVFKNKSHGLVKISLVKK